MRNLEWAHWVRRQCRTNSEIPPTNLVPNPQMVAQEQASAVNGGCCFLRAFRCLLVFPGGLEPAKASLRSKTHGHKGNGHAKSADSEKWPRTFRYRGIIWPTFVLPISFISKFRLFHTHPRRFRYTKGTESVPPPHPSKIQGLKSLSSGSAASATAQIMD